MSDHYALTTATIESDIIFPIDEVKRLNTPTYFWYNIDPFPRSDFTVGTIDESISYPFSGWINPNISKLSTQNTSVSRESRFEEEVAYDMTHELADIQQERLAPPTYDEEDVLNWDVAITPPPRPSGIIRVKLKFKGRKKPMPIDAP
jgi:hypothetical protein